jgi:hypothetical protein
VQVAVAAAAVVGYLIAVPLAGMYGAALVSTGSYVALVVMGIKAVAAGYPIRPSSFLPRLEDYAGFRAIIAGRGTRGDAERP